MRTPHENTGHYKTRERELQRETEMFLLTLRQRERERRVEVARWDESLTVIFRKTQKAMEATSAHLLHLTISLTAVGADLGISAHPSGFPYSITPVSYWTQLLFYSLYEVSE